MLKERFTFTKEISICGGKLTPTIDLKRHIFVEDHEKAEKGDTAPKVERFISGPAITRLYEFEELGMEPDELMEMIRECKATHDTKMLECAVCGRKFEPVKDRRYTVTRMVNMFTREVELGDAFDCPRCGCQVFVGSRKFEYEEEENA